MVKIEEVIKLNYNTPEILAFYPLVFFIPCKGSLSSLLGINTFLFSFAGVFYFGE